MHYAQSLFFLEFGELHPACKEGSLLVNVHPGFHLWLGSWYGLVRVGERVSVRVRVRARVKVSTCERCTGGAACGGDWSTTPSRCLLRSVL